MNVELAKLLFTPFVYLVAVALAVLLIWLFRKQLRQLLKYLGINNLKVAGIEISLSSEEIRIAQKNRSKEGIDEEEHRELALLAGLAAPYIAGRRVLWVDDLPLENIRERRALRLLGIEVVNRLNTPEAIEALCRDDYDLVISDIGRQHTQSPCDESVGILHVGMLEDDGWKTLSEIKRIHREAAVQVIFYHGSYEKNEERDSRAKKAGAVGATTSPATLYRWVLCTLLMKAVIIDNKLRHLIPVISEEMRRP